MINLFNEIIPTYEDRTNDKLFEVLVSSIFTQIKKSISMAQFGLDCVNSGRYVPIYYTIRDNDEKNSVIRKLESEGLKWYEVTADGGKTTTLKEFFVLIQEGYVFVTHVDYHRVISNNLTMLHAAINILPGYTRVDILDDCQEYIIRKNYSLLNEEEHTDHVLRLSTRDALLNLLQTTSKLIIYVTTTVGGFLGRPRGFDKVIELKQPQFHSGWDDIEYVESEFPNPAWDLKPETTVPLGDISTLGLFDDSFWCKVFEIESQRRYFHGLARVGADTRDMWVAAHNTALQLKKRRLNIGILVCGGTNYDPIQLCLTEENKIKTRFSELYIDDNDEVCINYAIADSFDAAAEIITNKYSNKMITFDFSTMTKMAKSPVNKSGTNPATLFYCPNLGSHSLVTIQRVGRLNGIYPDTNTARTLITSKDNIKEFKDHLETNEQTLKFLKYTEGFEGIEWRKAVNNFTFKSKEIAPNKHYPSHDKVDNRFIKRFNSLKEAQNDLPRISLVTHKIEFPSYDFDDIAHIVERQGKISKKFVKDHLLKRELFPSDQEYELFKKAFSMTLVHKSGESIRYLGEEYYDRFLRVNRAKMGEDSNNPNTAQAWNRLSFYLSDETGLLNCIIVHPDFTYSFIKNNLKQHLAHDVDGTFLYFNGDHGSHGLKEKRDNKIACNTNLGEKYA